MQYMDQSTILAGGQALVPDLLKRDLEMRLGTAQANGLEAQALSQRAEIAEQQSFQQAFEGLSDNPSPQAWAQITARFPKHAAGLKAAYAMSREPQDTADQTRMGEMYVAARNGRWDLVQKTLEARVRADKEAGHEDPADLEALVDLQSGDPAKRKRVADMIGMHLAMTMGSEHFASAYGALGLKPEASPEIQQKYEFMVGTAGKEAADRWLAGEMDPTKWIPVTEGGKVIPVGPGAPAAGVSPPSGSIQSQGPVASILTGAGFSAPVVAGFLGNFDVEGGYGGARGDGGTAHGIAQWRGERVTNFKRIIGKTPTEALPDEQARFVLWEMQNPEAAGMTVAQRDSILAAKSPAQAAALIDKYYERSSGAHRRRRMDAASRYAPGGTSDRTPIRVRSIQEARNLSPGTIFLTPDGRQKVR